MFNGTQKVNNQIVYRYKHLQNLKALTAAIHTSPDQCEIINIQERLLGRFVPAKKICFDKNGVICIGSGKEYVLSEQEQQILDWNPIQTRFICFEKIAIDNYFFSIFSHKPNSRRTNCYVQRNNGKLYQLVKFILIPPENNVNSDYTR